MSIPGRGYNGAARRVLSASQTRGLATKGHERARKKIQAKDNTYLHGLNP